MKSTYFKFALRAALAAVCIAHAPRAATAARNFNGSTTYLYASTAPTPTGSSNRSHAFRFRTTNVAVRQTILYTGAEVADQRFTIECRDSKLNFNNLSTQNPCATTLSNNTWYSVVVTVSSGTVTVYLDGVSDGSFTPTLSTGTGYGVGANGGAAFFLSGDVADWAGWNIALGAADVTAYTRGVSPRNLRPSALVFHANMVRSVYDTRAAASLVIDGTSTITDHPRIYR
jgi:hypothetical protein